MLLLFATAALAATLTVGASGTYATIGEAVAAASSGDAIEVEAGTYAECLDLSGKDLSLLGTDGSASTTLDGTGCDSVVVAAAGETALIEGFTLVNAGGRGVSQTGGALSLRDVLIADAGDSELYGGAIAVDGGSLSLASCSLSGNVAALGGAIYLTEGSTLTSAETTYDANGGDAVDGAAIWAGDGVIVESTDDLFTANLAESYADGYYGGAILLGAGGTLLVDGTTFSANEAYRGGAIYAPEGATIQLTDVNLLANIALEHGGAIYGRDGVDLTVSGSVFDTNSASYGSGGAVYLYGGGSLDLTEVELDDQYAWESGGAVYLEYGVVATVRDVGFLRNTADYGAGGAWYQYFYGSLTLQDCELTSNQAMEEGGAVVVDYLVGEVNIASSVFKYNSSEAGDGGGLWADTYLDLSISDSDFDSNVAAYDGAGVYAALVGEMAVRDTRFSANVSAEGNGAGLMMAPQVEDVYAVALAGLSFEANVAGMSGGGLYATGLSRLALSDSTFLGNTADTLGEGYAGGGAYVGGIPAASFDGNLVCGNSATRGGGVYLSTAGGTDNWHNNVLQENTASDAGGGLYLLSSTHSFVNNTLLGNSAGAAGGGAWYSDASLSLRNNIVAWTGDGDGLYTEDAETAAASSARYNAWYNNTAAHVGGSFTLSTTTDGNLEADPGFVDYTADGDCTNDDLTLSAGSALVDAGDPSLFDGDCTTSDIGADGGPWLDYVDADGDGYLGADCSGADCDDADPSVYPGATEIIDDGIDQDCDGADSVTPGDDTGDDTGTPSDDSAAPADDTGGTPPEDGCGGCGSKGEAGLFGLLLLGGLRRRGAQSAPQLPSHGLSRPRVLVAASEKPL